MKKRVLFCLPIVITLVLFVIYWMFLIANTKANWVEQPGTFGDSFGLLNTLFTGLAFSGLIIQIWMQREDLTESRKQFERSANAQERSARLSAYSDLLREYNEQVYLMKVEIAEHSETYKKPYSLSETGVGDLAKAMLYKYPRVDEFMEVKRKKQNILNELERYLQSSDIS
ncbi:hypothetical protein HC024_19350 [Methylococcaceae bacterium WWC4]|nr:hypothetical protein [Methylococcaceae bacterium WWC4]